MRAGVGAPSLVARGDWVIRDAQKVESRVSGRYPRSKWRVECLHLPTGSIVVSDLLAQSNVKTESKPTRKKRYPGQHGSTAVVKDLVSDAGARSLPRLVVKSFSRWCWTGSEISPPIWASLKLSSQYLRAQGFCSYVAMHPRCYPGVEKQKPFVVMEKVGDGRDLKQLSRDKADKGKLLDTDDSWQQFIRAFIRLLAFIEFFHQHEKRPILDIKAKNLMPILNTLGQLERLVVIDLDSSFGDSLVMSPASMSKADFTLAAGQLDGCNIEASIDFRVLANVLAETIHFITPDKFFDIQHVGDYGYIDVKLKRGAPPLPLIDLFKQLTKARGGISARNIVSHSFHAFDARVYLKIFDDEFSSLQRRFDAVVGYDSEAPRQYTSETGQAGSPLLFKAPSRGRTKSDKVSRCGVRCVIL
ncbi:MAG: hypothetical protein P1U40_06720 [Coxiellaceae bacterium]|nr:hypothetical protein [Coxiellaceae bacterium]